MTDLSERFNTLKLDNEFNSLNSNDRKSLVSSMPLDAIQQHLEANMDQYRQKGIDLYKKGKLTPQVANKMDNQQRVNNFTDSFISDVLTHQDAPDAFSPDEDSEALDGFKPKFSAKAINNGSFQKDIMRDVNSYMGSDKSNHYESDSLDPSNMRAVLQKEMNKEFSKPALKYFHDELHPTKVHSFSDLAKQPHDNNLNNKIDINKVMTKGNSRKSTVFKPHQSTDEKEYKNRSKFGRSQSNRLTKSQILAAKRNQGRQR